MNITTTGKNLTVTPALKEYVEKKIGKLERYFDQISDARVAMEVEGTQQIVEVTLRIDSIYLRAEVEETDMYAAIDLASDKLERQVAKHKDKLYKKTKHKALALPFDDLEYEEEDLGVVVKTKKFSTKPMELEEAILQMELLGHDFYVFRLAETGETSVLYKRHDGNYGLIEPTY